MVLDPKSQSFVNTLWDRQHSQRLHTKARNVRNDIRSDEFWEECTKFVKVVEPVLIALREFDRKVPAMPRAWVVMSTLKEHVYSLREHPYELSHETASRYERAFEKRWEMMLTDLHYAAVLLNPYLSDVAAIQNNGEGKRALNRVLKKLSVHLGVVYEEVVRELVQFEERTGPFNTNLEALDPTECNLLPHQWWHRVGGNALPKIAKRILSLTCFALSCERNWSMYSFVYNKVRNRLNTSKAEALVYIHANSKLERHRRGETSARWYEKHIEEEDSDQEEGEVIPEDEGDVDGIEHSPAGGENNVGIDPSEDEDPDDFNE